MHLFKSVMLMRETSLRKKLMKIGEKPMSVRMPLRLKVKGRSSLLNK